MKAQNLNITFDIISDSFPVLEKKVTQYEKHCVTYLIHNNKQIYVGETSHLKSRFKDHQKSKEAFKLLHTKIIFSAFFNKSAIYDIESRLINYMYADQKFELINIKKDQASHNYYLKDQINDQLFKNIWAALKEKDLVSSTLAELENKYLFKYSPFKEFSEDQNEVISKAINLVSISTSKETIGFDGSVIQLRELATINNQVLISGGPGTGKTLIIVKLVHDLVKRYGVDPKDIIVCIPQSNLLKTFKIMFKQAKLKVKLVKPVEISKIPNSIPLLIVDEAHRLKKHFSKQTKDLKHLRGGELTELEIVRKKSQNLILMYDADQSVRPADVDPKQIQGLDHFHKLQLNQQFRVRKGKDYLKFIKGLLQIENVEISASDLGEYDFKIVDDIQKLHSLIIKRNAEHGVSRLASGYYKKWISKTNRSKYDFEDEGLKLKWNTTIEGWVSSPNSINEVGCIHTLQGEDLHYAGVIIGDEIYLDPKDSKIKIRKEFYFDKNGTPVNGTDENDSQLSEYIKNIYYVLLSRGMLGTYVFIKDKNLRKWISSHISMN